MQTLASPLPEPIGKLGRYQLMRLIGVGGMAEVYLALDTGGLGLDRWVAIKRIRDDLVRDARFTDMLLDEARLAARISHPNVAQVFDLGHSDGAPYIAMEYLNGRPFSEVLDRALDVDGGFDTDLACRIVAHACEGAHAAHELVDSEGRSLGLVHRDLSPHNIMITRDGNVKVLDFGIAKAAGRSVETLPGLRKGKLSYMSPEQIRGEELDRRTDVYALGLVLYEGTTGRSAFGEISAVLRLKATLVEPPSAHREGYPEELESIVLLALDPARDRRFSTAREMAQSLERFVVGRRALTGPSELASMMARLFPDSEERPLVCPRRGINIVPAQIEISQPVRAHFSAGRTVTRTRVRPEPGRWFGARWARTLGIAATLTVIGAGAGSIFVAQANHRHRAKVAAPVSAQLISATPEPPVEAPTHHAPLLPEAAAEPRERRTSQANNGRPGGDLSTVLELGLPAGSPRQAAQDRAPPGRKRASPKPPRKMGTIDVQSEPWSQVFIDGAPVQATPLVGLPLEAGTHELKLVASDGRTRRTRVKVLPSQPTTVDVTF
jgi:serine/threonine-protein kinase